MQYTHRYLSPLGEILLAADDIGLTGLWFVGQAYFARGLNARAAEVSLPIFDDTCRWLDLYFSGREPDFSPALHLTGTAFQKAVWEVLRTIPYGQTTTYGEIARMLSSPKTSQAVGGAVGHNPVSIIVPCHRVVGRNGSLTGYAGGIQRKQALLELEHR